MDYANNSQQYLNDDSSACLYLNQNDSADVRSDVNSTSEQNDWDKDVKKKRNAGLKNKRVRKYVQPKNAVMCLNEIRSGLQFVTEHENNIEPFFVISVQMDGEKFVGSGKSKQVAKQEAAEAALASLVKPTTFLGSFSGEDIPWASVASFALYKLLKEWDEKRIANMSSCSYNKYIGRDLQLQMNDSADSAIHMNSSCSPPPVASNIPLLEISPQYLAILKAHLEHHEVENFKPQPAKQVPDNASDLHPVMVLHQMKPDIEYNIKNITPENKNWFSVTSVLDGEQFTGEGPTIKKAKLQLAKQALRSLFNVESTYENTEPKKD